MAGKIEVCTKIDMIDHKHLSINYIDIITNFENIECSYDISLSLHQKSQINF